MRQHQKHGHARGASARSAFDSFKEALHGGDAGRPFDPRHDRKTLQLCRQVERAMLLAMAGDGDDALQEVSIDGVEPMGSASQLLVRVGVPPTASPADVVARLNARAPQLRAAVASAICRKRVPTLTFVAVPSGSEVHRD